MTDSESEPTNKIDLWQIIKKSWNQTYKNDDVNVTDVNATN
ncbi:MAG: hypothetical protein ACYDH2_09105 [Anaerolineaceae bacterium]